MITTAPAGAHAVLVASDPLDGSRLAHAPAQVTLTFDESVRAVSSASQVITDSGERVDTGLTQVDAGAKIILALRPKLPDGSYTVTWKVISADSHEVVGAISFGVGRDAHPAVQPSRHNETGEIWPKLVPGALFVGLVLALGVGLVCALLWPETLGRTVTKIVCGVGIYLVVAGSEIQLTAHAGDHTGGPPDGPIALARIAIALVLVGIGIALLRKVTRTLIAVSAIGGVVLAATIAPYGHGGVGADANLATIATTAHLVAMAVWLGGLIAICLTAPTALSAGSLRHWSKIASSCVFVLAATGVYQAWRQISPLQALWSTHYGLTLCAKVVGVAVMLGLAISARRYLTTCRLRRAVALEAGMGVMVLAVTTVLVTMPPARSSYGPPISLSAPLEQGKHIEVNISSTRRGPTAIQAAVLDDHGRPLPAESINGALSSSDANIPSLPVDFKSEARNHWQSNYASVPRPGEWTLRLTVRLAPESAIVTSVKFRVW